MITVRYIIRDGYGEWQEAVGKGTTVTMVKILSDLDISG